MKIILISLLLVAIALFGKSVHAQPFCSGQEATIIGTFDDDVINGTDGPDVIVGLAGNDVIRGHGGDDVICGNKGDDLILGGEGNDMLFGGLGNDILKSQVGDDRLSGGWGDDFHNGGPGNDKCLDKLGDNTIKSCELPHSLECSLCPCDFFSAPMTTGCWPQPEFRTGENPNFYSSLCTLAPREGFYGFGMGILSKTNCHGPGGFGCCVIFTSQDDSPKPPACTVSRAVELLHSNQEVEGCLTCLELYASELNNTVRNGVIGGPPYACISDDPAFGYWDY